MPLTDDPWLPAPNEDGTYPTVRPAAPINVYRFDGSTLFALPNVECLSIVEREGTDPSSATFRYNLASGLAGAPATIEQALGTGTTGDYLIQTADRLVVQATNPAGLVQCIFDGEAVDFGMGLGADEESVWISAIGIAWHAWDFPIGGAIIRDGSNPTKVTDLATDVIAHFNPDGQANCTPVGYEAGTKSDTSDRLYPTFLDPSIIREPVVLTSWDVAKGVRYILYTCNPTEQYVTNPDGSALDTLLGTSDDKGNPVGSVTPVDIPDLPITGRDWPGTVYKLVREIGFGMHFRLLTQAGGLPQTGLDIFGQQAGTLKSIYLAARGTPFDPSQFNFNAASVHRDVGDVVNQWTVQGGLTRWEASFVLAAGFPSSSGDGASITAIAAFDKGSPVYTTTNRNAYRLYIFDETGEGHYAPGKSGSDVDKSVASLDDLFGEGNYANRRRKAFGDLLSLDELGKAYDARLAVSTDYTGPSPGIWDGTGTWQTVTTSSWRVLPDRLGIEITERNPNAWEIGQTTETGKPFPAGVVKGVESQCGATGATRFFVRFTAAIESDNALDGVSSPSGQSPITRTIARIIDARDRYRKGLIYAPSEFNAGSNVKVARDDSALATAEARALKVTTEAGVLEGPVTIPRFTAYYEIGDRIEQIEGRGLGFRTDSGADGSVPVYPVVIARRFDFKEDEQTTTLEFSDAGADRRRYKRQVRKVTWNRRGWHT